MIIPDQMTATQNQGKGRFVLTCDEFIIGSRFHQAINFGGI